LKLSSFFERDNVVAKRTQAPADHGTMSGRCNNQRRLPGLDSFVQKARYRGRKGVFVFVELHRVIVLIG
jgi:hypothetical protein